jgi:hypothetical protein
VGSVCTRMHVGWARRIKKVLIPYRITMYVYSILYVPGIPSSKSTDEQGCYHSRLSIETHCLAGSARHLGMDSDIPNGSGASSHGSSSHMASEQYLAQVED